MKLSNFQLIESLGRGGYGDVTLAKCKTNCDGVTKNQLVAIKIIKKVHVRSIMREVEVGYYYNY